jgi:hypothetical protein
VLPALAGRAKKFDRLAWALLAVAMCVSATWLMLAGRGLTISGDEVYYYARFIDDGGAVRPGGGLEYFLAPHNGHLVVLGKLIYRGLFLTVGTDYTVFRALEVAAVLATVLLFFVLVRRRLGPIWALIPSVLLLFLGFAAETLVWPFNLHTVLALAFGLGAVLSLEREDRRGDLLACGLLFLSIACVELGLAFAVGVAVSVIRRPDRARRAWIFAAPIAIYVIWWLWARRFGQTNFELTNVHLIPTTLTDALTAVIGSLLGLNPTGEGVPTYVTTVTGWATAAAVLAAIGLGLRIRRGSVPRWLWVSLGVVLAYWLMIAMSGSPGDSVRYVFVGSVMVLLIAADAVRGMRLTRVTLIVAGCVVALAIPPNVAKLYDALHPRVVDAENTRAEDAMLELARPTVSPRYVPGIDPRVETVGGHVNLPLSAGHYFRASDEFGSLAYSLEELRGKSERVRLIADTALVDALRISTHPTDRPSEPEACATSRDGYPGHSVYFPLPRRGVLLGPHWKFPVNVELSRFGDGDPGVELGQLAPDRWATLRAPSDSAPTRWRVWVDGPVYVCPLAR